MRDISDVLMVSFYSELQGGAAMCVARKCEGKIVALKMELG